MQHQTPEAALRDLESVTQLLEATTERQHELIREAAEAGTSLRVIASIADEKLETVRTIVHGTDD